MKAMARLALALSLVFGLGYLWLWDRSLAPAAMIAAKGAGVGLLAVAAALRARSADGWLLAALLALGAAGDVLLEIDLAAGAIAFAAGHIVAIALYLRNRRPAPAASDWVVVALVLGLGTAVPINLLAGLPEAVPFGAYALFVAGMAASAWMSRFSRLVPLGALLFLLSDILIAVRMGRAMTALEPAIWLLYYLGQLMIFLGVTSSLPAQPVGRGTTRSVVEG